MADSAKELDALRKDIEQLKKDLKAAAGDGGDLMASMKDQLEEEAEKIMHRMRGTAQSLGSNVRQAADTVIDQGEQALHTVEAKITEKPLSSVLMTFGAGIALGWLLSRK